MAPLVAGEAGLFRLWVPRSVDAPELDLPPALEVFEAASRLDGSFGWAVTIGTGGGLFAAFLEPATAAEALGPRAGDHEGRRRGPCDLRHKPTPEG